MTALTWICAYLLGAIITYGLCWNYLNTSKTEAELKAEHPDISPPAYRLTVIATSATLAAIWPVTAAEHQERLGGGPGSLTEAGARFLTQTIPDRKDHR